MATSKTSSNVSSKDADQILKLIAIITIPVFIIFLGIFYFLLSVIYKTSDADARTYQMSIFFRYAVRLVSFLFLAGLISYMFWSYLTENNLSYKLFLLIIPPLLVYALAVIARGAAYLIGAVVNLERNVLIIPRDVLSYGFVKNIFKLQILWGWFTMDELPFSEIKKITREKGNTMFIHGDFGSRKLVWCNKQKRDECIEMIERLSKHKLSSLDLGL